MQPRRIAEIIWRAGFLALTAVSVAIFVATNSIAQDARPLRGLALVIGNGQYEHLRPLANPPNDARAVESLLDELGFETTLVSDRGARQLSRALEGFIDEAAGADVVVVYYAGHGIEAGGENFLVPVDAAPSALEAAREKLVPVSGFIQRLRATAPLTIVMLDACRDNPFPASSMVRLDASSAPVPMGASGLGETRGGKRLTEPEPSVESIGTVIAFAAEPGRAALDGEAGGNSPYTAALLRHLDAMAAGEEFGVVMRMVGEEVYLKTSGKQRPWINESLRRRLYFGTAPVSMDGEEGEILAERRQLLLTIAALPDLDRRQVERVADEGGVPMDAIYGILRALGSDIPDDPAELDALLRSEAERFAKVLAEREAIDNPDPEIVRLSTLADGAEREGLLITADRFRERAKARFRELEPTLAGQEEALRQRFVEGAAVFARSAETKALAFDHLAAAQDYAEAFSRVESRDARLAWRYKLAEAKALTDHGAYKGDNAALRRAIAAGRRALVLTSREASPLDWATTQNYLGNALQTLGGNESGTAGLEEAVEAYRAALQERTRERMPLDWAATQNDLGNALWTLGGREAGTGRLAEAIEAYRAALEERTRERVPFDWALTQTNLGNALQTLGGREGGTARLEEAVESYRAALQEQTRERVPLAWAATQNNLGVVLWTLGGRESGTARLEEAVEAYRAALRERTRERVPLDWASTQNNLGLALKVLGGRESGTTRLEEAVDAYRAALQERSRERVPLDWAATQNNLGAALRTLGEREGGTAKLEESVEAYRAALLEITRERVPLDWATTQNNLGGALAELGKRSGRSGDVEKGLAAIVTAWECYREAGYSQYDNYFRRRIAEVEAELAALQ